MENQFSAFFESGCSTHVLSIRYKLACANSKDSNQSAHLHSQIRFLFYPPGPLATHGAPIEGSDQTVMAYPGSMI